MHHSHILLKRVALSVIVAVQALAYPALAIAQSTDPATDPAASTTQTTQASESTADSQGQPPDDSYTYNEETGLWENSKYTWNPETYQTAPKQQTNYSYNPETEAWDTTEYKYDTGSGTYQENTTASTPQPTTTSSGATGTSGSSTPTPAASTTSTSGGSEGSQSIIQTGPNSDNTISSSTDRDITFDLFYNASISNNIDSVAITGDAGVLFNTIGGSATSGNAKAVANLLNMLQSSWNPANGDIATFVADLNGGITGDLMLDPSALIKQTGSSSNNTVNSEDNTDLTVNVSNEGTINNNVNLTARSGDAAVSNNTQAGDATSGDASAVANILNLMNTMITSGTSFFGALNIHGDLDGDILLPHYILQQLIAHTGPDSNNEITSSNDVNADVDVSNNYAVNNNIDLLAGSGSATVSNNTSAGDATTGSANTSLKILNLTGRDITSTNGLLVFVNVLDEWVGLIMNVPGANSLLLTGPSSNNTITTDNNVNADVNVKNVGTINNNINVAAQTGDATVSNNTQAGDATSGDAHAAANVVNLMNSQLDFSSWFGVLFINIFGDWRGSFGVNTEAGNPINPVTGGKGGGEQVPSAGSDTPKRPFIDYRPKMSEAGGSGGGSTADNGTFTNGVVASASGGQGQEAYRVLGVSTAASQAAETIPENLPNTGFIGAQTQPASWWPMIVSAIAGLVLLGAERILGLFRNRG